MFDLKDEDLKVLHLLAIRAGYQFINNDSDMTWVSGKYDPRADKIEYTCLICQTYLGYNPENHGYLHLKEKNFLPFI